MIGSRRMHASAREHAIELRECRLKAHLSQVQLAAELGVSRRTICRWESGRGRMHRVYLRRIRELAQTTAEVSRA
jgi:transcriptional regulator with XRE-family HTH domain